MARKTQETLGPGAGRMSARTAAWLAWSLWALCVVLVAVTGVLYLFTPPSLTRGTPAFWGAFFVTLSLAYPTVGAVVASRRPDNPIGWILCAVGLVLGVQTVAAGYAKYGLLVLHQPLPVHSTWPGSPAGSRSRS